MTRTFRIGTRTVVTLVLLAFAMAGTVSGVGGVAAVAPAQAQQDKQGEQGKRGALLIILDSSGSMGRKGADGQSLMASARQATDQLVQALPDNAPVGLRVYGSEVPSSGNKNKGCKDTHLAVPVQPLDRQAITQAVASFEPTGYTPIGYALRQGAKDLPAEGKRTIVLISDGKDSCPPDPCKVAKQLADQGVDLTVNAVGLALRDPEAKRQLKCLAEATGGRYTGANSAESLAEALQTFSTRAVQRYQPQGKSVQGGAASTDAPVLEPGSYTDTIVGDEARWYGIRLEKGQGLVATVTQPGIPNLQGIDNEDLYLKLYNPALEEILEDANGNLITEIKGLSSSATVLRAGTRQVDTENTYAAQPGVYYVQVKLKSDEYGRSLGSRELPLQIDLKVTGAAASSPTPSSEASAASAAPSQGSSAKSVAAAEETSSSGVPAVLWAVIGVLAVLVLGLGAALLAVLLRRSSGGLS